jgi:hypothetical protein
MSTSGPRLTIANLVFTGATLQTATFTLLPGLNVLFGASNTGKSFTVKTIDFMLGSTRPLPDIRERNGFDRAWMAIRLPKAGDVTLMRPLVGGSLELYPTKITFVSFRRSTVTRMPTTYPSSFWKSSVLPPSRLQSTFMARSGASAFGISRGSALLTRHQFKARHRQ